MQLLGRPNITPPIILITYCSLVWYLIYAPFLNITANFVTWIDTGFFSLKQLFCLIAGCLSYLWLGSFNCFLFMYNFRLSLTIIKAICSCLANSDKLIDKQQSLNFQSYLNQSNRDFNKVCYSHLHLY